MLEQSQSAFLCQKQILIYELLLHCAVRVVLQLVHPQGTAHTTLTELSRKEISVSCILHITRQQK